MRHHRMVILTGVGVVMKTHVKTGRLTGFLVGSGLVAGMCMLSGCTTASAPGSPVNVIYSPPAQKQAAANEGRQPARKSYEPESRDVEFTSARVATSGSGRRVTPIGLFGEGVTRRSTSTAGTQYDGEANISPVSFSTEGTCFDPDVDPTGEWVVFASTMHRSTSDIYVKSTHGRTLTQITSDPSDDVMPSFSPDGRLVAFSSNRGGNWDIYVTTMDGASPRQLTSDLDHEVHPTWSPDGTKLAFCKYGSRSGRWEIWVVDLENTAVTRFLEYGVFPEWCPDIARSKIVFQRARQRGSQFHSIWTVDYIDGEAKHPTEIISAANAALIAPSWSPNGQRIVFSSVINPDPNTAPQLAEIWQINSDGTGRTGLITGNFSNTQPVWSSNGNIYFVSNRSGVDNIWAAPAGRTFEFTPEEVGPRANTNIATVDPTAGGTP